MRIDSNTAAVESSGLGEQGAFSIKTTAAAFQLLSSGLYTNKIRAVVRELSCNAIDAHVMPGGSGKETPIEVKLPNTLDSQFYVKDSGPGLPHDKIMSLYTTYFDSSKQQSDDFIGGFGVGSKSPFAYTDSFTVESRHGGVKNIYSAYIGDDGSPKIAQMASVPMEENEPTGLTVSMPVRPADFNAFEKEALDLFQWFDTTPNLTGTARTIQKTELTPTSDPSVSLRKSSGYGQYVLVRMGQVVYSVDNYRSQAEPEIVEALSTMQQFRPLIEVPIGAISVAASREDVAYDKKTKAYLATAIGSLYQSIGKSIAEHLSKLDLTTLKGRFEGYTFLNNYGLANSGLLSSTDLATATKAGRKINQLNRMLAENNVNPDPFLPIFQGLKEPTVDQSKVVHVSMPYIKDAIKNWSSSYRSWDPNAYRQEFSLLELDMEPTILYAERARKNYAIKHPSNAVRTIVLQRRAGVSDADYERVKKEILSDWGMPDQSIQSLSSFMSKEDKVRYDKSNATQAIPALTFFSSRTTICTSDIKKFYYLPWDNDRVPNAQLDPSWDASNLNTFVANCQETNADLVKGLFRDMGAEPPALARMYLVNPTHLDKVKTFPGATNLLDVFKNGMTNDLFLQKWMAAPLMRDSKSNSTSTWAGLLDSSAYARSSRGTADSAIDKLQDTQLGQLLSWYKTLSTVNYDTNGNPDDNSQYQILAQKLATAMHANIPPRIVDTQDLNNTVRNRYPLLAPYLQAERWGLNEEKLQFIHEYLQFRDDVVNAPLLPGVTVHPSPARPHVSPPPFVVTPSPEQAPDSSFDPTLPVLP